MRDLSLKMKTQYKILKVLLKNLKISKNLRIPVAMVSTAAYRLGDMASWLLGQDGSTVRHAEHPAASKHASSLRCGKRGEILIAGRPQESHPEDESPG